MKTAPSVVTTQQKRPFFASNQFFQNSILYDHAQGGEGQAVRGEGEVAGLLAVGEEGPLMGRKGGAAPALVLGQVQPGGQPQL